MNEDQKWVWKMKFCKRMSIPPAQTWAWDRAEKALKEYLNEQ